LHASYRFCIILHQSPHCESSRPRRKCILEIKTIRKGRKSFLEQKKKGNAGAFVPSFMPCEFSRATVQKKKEFSMSRSVGSFWDLVTVYFIGPTTADEGKTFGPGAPAALWPNNKCGLRNGP
jgi:hypothetical protein